jgi:hypothetical protein
MDPKSRFPKKPGVSGRSPAAAHPAKTVTTQSRPAAPLPPTPRSASIAPPRSISKPLPRQNVHPLPSKPAVPHKPAAPTTTRGPNPISARISRPPTVPLTPEFDNDIEDDTEATPMPAPMIDVKAEPKTATLAPPAPAPAIAQKPKAAAPDADKAVAAPRAALPHKKIVVGLIAMIVVLVCVIAGLLIKRHGHGAGSAVLDSDGGDSNASGSNGGGAANPTGSRVAFPLVPEFAKKRARSAHNLLLASDGAVATGGQRPELLNDGNNDNYDGSNGYAYTDNNDPNQAMVITLKAPVQMTRIRFLLWDKDERSYRYIASVSADGKNFKKVQDNSKRESRSWQQIRFARQKVKAVQIKGIAGTSDNNCHVVEIEGYDDGGQEDQFTKRTPPKGSSRVALSNMKPGVWAEFFDGLDTFPAAEDTPDLTRPQNSLAFGVSTPATKGEGLHDWPFCGACGATFSGYLNIEKQNLYTFFLESENGARLYLDGELLINNEGDHKFQELWEQIDLSAGLHRIYVEHYTFGAATGLNVSIKPKGESKEYISDRMLCYDPNEVHGVDPQTRRPADAPRLVSAPMVKFIKRDDKRGGNWRNTVGRDGYVLFNKVAAGQHLQKLPAYIAAFTSAAEHCVWNVGDDPRELEDPEGKGPRMAACEYSGGEVLFDIRATKNIVHHLSIYCLDFDKLNRKNHFQFLSGDTVLYEMDVNDFGAGAWLEFEVAGSIQIKVGNNNSAVNAVISGIFWDSERGIHYRTPPKDAPPAAENLKPGVVAEYFDNIPSYATDDDLPTTLRLEPTLAFGATPPPSGERVLHNWPLSGACAAVFSGCIKIAADDKYSFSLTSDDGSHLYIDGNKVIDNDGSHGMKEVEGAVDLKAGVHRIWIDYFNGGGPMGLNLMWKQKDGKKVPIPPDLLGH